MRIRSKYEAILFGMLSPEEQLEIRKQREERAAKNREAKNKHTRLKTGGFSSFRPSEKEIDEFYKDFYKRMDLSHLL